MSEVRVKRFDRSKTSPLRVEERGVSVRDHRLDKKSPPGPDRDPGRDLNPFPFPFPSRLSPRGLFRIKGKEEIREKGKGKGEEGHGHGQGHGQGILANLRVGSERGMFSRSMLSNERGLGALFYGVFLMAIFIVTSMVINVGYGFTQRQKLQHAVDATAIGVGEMAIEDETLRNNADELLLRARERFELNLERNGIDPSRLVTPLVAEALPEGGPPYTKLHVSASIDMPGFLISLFQGPVTREATYEFSGGGKPVIAALVMDVSRYVPAAQIQWVKDAAAEFVNKLNVGDYFALITFGEVYCVPLPVDITKIVDQPSNEQGERTKQEIIAAIANGVYRNCDPTNVNNREGTYLQGAIYKARNEVMSLQGDLGGSWNSFSKYIIAVTDCRVNRSSPGNAPISDSLDLDTITKTQGQGSLGMPQGQCNLPTTNPAVPSPNDEPKMRAAAIHQSDLARRQGIEMFVIATSRTNQCTVANYGAPRQTALRRLAYDSGWDGIATTWATDPSLVCGGYQVSQWCTKGLLYQHCASDTDCDTETALGDGECEAPARSAKQRYWLLPNNFSEAAYRVAVSDRAAEMKRGRLVPD